MPGTQQIVLREYQQKALDALRRGRSSSGAAQLVVLPTGAGKTIVAASDIKSFIEETGGRAMFVAHRDELIRQAADKIQMVWPEARIGVVKAAENEIDRPVTVASVQTVYKDARLQPILDHGPIDLLYIDEAHHAAADSYAHIIEVVRAANPNVQLVGLTATPVRADAVKLDKIFDKITYQCSMLDLIEQGYLSDIHLKQVDIHVSIDGVPVRRGDLKPSVLREVLTQDHVMASVVDAWKSHASGRRTLAFCVDVEHARQLAATFNARGVKARMVHGETATSERRETFAAFQRGEFDVLSNCLIATEGYDDIAFFDDVLGEYAPPLDCILSARPTLSQSLFIQQVGRGTRPAPGKDKLLLLDFSYSSSRHHLVQLPHLFGLEAPDGTKGEPKEREENEDEEEKEIPSILAAVRAARDVDVHAPPPRAGFNWAESEYGFALALGRDQGFLLIRESVEEKYHGLYNVWHFSPKAGEGWNVPYKRICLTTQPLTFDWAFGLAEDAVRTMRTARSSSRRYGRKNALIDREADWHNLEPTEKQLKVLQKCKKQPRNRGEARDMITAIMVDNVIRGMAPATGKQKGFLRWKKISYAADITKTEAKRLIADWHRQNDEKKS